MGVWRRLAFKVNHLISLGEQGWEPPHPNFLKGVKDLKDENRIVEEILQAIGLEQLESTTPKGCGASQLKSKKQVEYLPNDDYPARMKLKKLHN